MDGENKQGYILFNAFSRCSDVQFNNHLNAAVWTKYINNVFAMQCDTIHYYYNNYQRTAVRYWTEDKVKELV